VTDKKLELKRQVILSSRDKDISYAIFRNAIGKKLGLHGMDFIGVSFIFSRGSIAPSELARYTGLSPGSTTAMLDRLEKSGLVVRRPRPDDRRGVQVTLTTNGTKKIALLFRSARAAQEELLADASEYELQILSDYFRRSAAALEEECKKIR
jgi:DNA-binding MarR family transcriptional regulator